MRFEWIGRRIACGYALGWVVLGWLCFSAAGQSLDPSAEASRQQIRQITDELIQGYFGPVSEQQVAMARGGQLVPVLKDCFDRSTEPEIKAKVAGALVELHDADDIYWNYLVEEARPALETDAPSPACNVPPECPSARYTAWARAHNVIPGSPEEQAVYNAFVKVEYLGAPKDPRAIPLLRKALGSPNSAVQAAAAQGLAYMDDKDSIPLIVAACRKAPRGEAVGIAASLQLFPEPSAQRAADEFLLKKPDDLESLEDGDEELLPSAIERLVKANRVDALPALREKFASLNDPPTKAHIASALVRLGAKEPVYWDYLYAEARRGIETSAPSATSESASGQPSTAQTEPGAGANRPREPSAAAGPPWATVLFLATTGDPRGIPVLREALRSANIFVESNAARGLALIGDRDSIPDIVEACRKASRDEASLIGVALAYFNDAEARSAAEKYVSPDMLKALRESIRDGRTSPFD